MHVQFLTKGVRVNKNSLWCPLLSFKLVEVGLSIVNSLMTLSVIAFYIGYFFRKSNNGIHRWVNSFGVVANLIAAVFLLLVKYELGGLEAYSIYPAVDRWIIDTHRFFAACSLILMLVMSYFGISRNRNLHYKLHFVFLPLYTLVYLSGLVIFQSSPLGN